MPHYVYKSLTIPQWDAFQKDKVFKGSPLDIQDGFIHMSREEQLPGVLQKFMSDEDEVVIAKIDTQKLKDTLIFEANRPGGDQYPHLYGTLSLDAVEGVERRKP